MKCSGKGMYIFGCAKWHGFMVNTEDLEGGRLYAWLIEIGGFGGFVVSYGVSGYICDNVGVRVGACVGCWVMIPFCVGVDDDKDVVGICLCGKSCPVNSLLSIL